MKTFHILLAVIWSSVVGLMITVYAMNRWTVPFYGLKQFLFRSSTTLDSLLVWYQIRDMVPNSLMSQYVDDPHLKSYPAWDAPQVNGHYLTEKEIMKIPGSRCVDEIVSAKASTLILINPVNGYKLGSDIVVRLDARTRNGTQIRRGGDSVRMWLREVKKQANAAGYVVDLRNGSYVGVLRAMWVGNPEVLATIATPLEQIQLMYRIQQERGTLWEINGVFVGNETKETSMCYPTYPPENGQQVCNLTDVYHGMEWYCYKPKTLGCDTWQDVTSKANQFLNLSAFERKELPNIFHQKLSATISVNVINGTNQFSHDESVSCHKRPYGLTHFDTTPVGYFYGGKWRLSHCDANTKSPLSAYGSCLSNKTMYMFGDSTTRFLFRFMERSLSLVLQTPNRPHQVRYLPEQAWNAKINFTLHRFSHELPYFNEYIKEPIHFHLDSLPPSFSGIVFITMYQHLTPFHPDIFRKRIRYVIDGIGRLVRRAPDAVVAIRGCHAYYHEAKWIYYSIVFDDYQGKMFDRIWKEELFPLRDRVVFVDAWDMTVSGENSDRHPPDSFMEALLQHLFAFVCE